jgi:hypothetical protein
MNGVITIRSRYCYSLLLCRFGLSFIVVVYLVFSFVLLSSVVEVVLKSSPRFSFGESIFGGF